MNVAPPTRLERILNCLERASDPGDLQSVIVELRGHFRIDHLVYHWVSADGDQYGCGTYPPEWVSRYLQNDYLRIDPVVLGCYQRFHPVDWKRLDWSSRTAREFLADAQRHGIGNQGYYPTEHDPKKNKRAHQMKPFNDTNGDGVLDEKEKAAARQDLIKRFDTNGDGQLSDAEKEQARKTVREALQRRRGQGNTRR